MSVLDQISRRQSVSDVLKNSSLRGGLRKVLGVGDLLAFGISSTLGSGIFVTVGVISQFAGPGLFLSFAIASFGCLLSAYCYAEFGCRLPVSGQSYTYTYVALGELVAFITGWLGFLAYSIATAAVSRGWATHLATLIRSAWGLSLPAWLVDSPVESLPHVSISGLAAFLNLACTILACLGITHSTRLAYILVIINFSLMVGFSLYGAVSYGSPSNLTPLLPFGLTGVLKGSGLAFFCSTGWELTCTLSEEVKHPGRDLPRGIMGALLAVTVLYCAVCLTLSSMVPFNLISVSAPIADAFLFHEDKKGALLVAFTVVVVCIPSTISGIIGTPRIIYKMAQDGLLFPCLGSINKHGSPVTATVLCGFFSAVLAGFLNFESLAATCSACTLFMFTLVCIGVLVIRVNDHSFSNKSRLSSRLTLSLPVFVLTSFLFCTLLVETDFSFDVWVAIFGLLNLASAALCVKLYKSALQESFQTSLIGQALVIEDTSLAREIFLCPYVPFLPLLAAWGNILMIASLGYKALVGLTSLLISGLIIYFSYGIQHSKLRSR